LPGIIGAVKKTTKRYVADLNRSRKEQPILFWLRVITVAAVIVLFLVKRNFWTPDTLFIVLLAMFVVLGQAREFILRFAPFVLLLLAYDSFRGIADDLNKNVHFFEMINTDMVLFGGHLPTVDLQRLLWHGHLQWYDFYFYFLYTIHFLAPVALALILWKLHEKLFWPFVWALVGLSFAAFITYVIFPAAPPWMASDMGFIPQIHHISSDVWGAMGVDNPSEFYAKFSPNLVAAVPSLHSAYPLLFVLFIFKAFGWRRFWWLALYPLSMWFGVVYLGEHYVTDVLLGILYAILAYFGSLKLFTWARAHDISFKDNFKHHYKRGYDWAYTRIKR
jgi:membrane-associated phospholipid phosphatase